LNAADVEIAKLAARGLATDLDTNIKNKPQKGAAKPTKQPKVED